MKVFFGLCIANFIYEGFSDQLWLEALKVSYFQGVSIMAYRVFGGAK